MEPWESDPKDLSSDLLGALPMPVEAPPMRNTSRSSSKTARSFVSTSRSTQSIASPKGVDRADRASKRCSRDASMDEFGLDLKHMTSTLNANLVSEILALRRDQEEKVKVIESLESSLLAIQEEGELREATHLATAKKSRSLRRQLALLEGGSSFTIGELARERDEAMHAAAESKKRLEAAQKKTKSQEEQSARVHSEWAKEKEDWEEEKRELERKIHVVETHLKVMLDEVAALHAAQANEALSVVTGEGGENAKENDAESVRTISMTNSVQFSMANDAIKLTGNSLADELGWDDEDGDETDRDGRESGLSNRHTRNMSRDSVLSSMHRRNQSNGSPQPKKSLARGKLATGPSTFERREDGTIPEGDEDPWPIVEYVETGVQYSPPDLHKPTPGKAYTARFERAQEIDILPRADSEIEANQRRKRTRSGQPLIIRMLSFANLMVHGSSQTGDEPLSPPKTPKTPVAEIVPSSIRFTRPTTSAATQTDDVPSPTSSLLPIPKISIIPPTSRPSTPQEHRLPQLTRDFGCQVSIPQGAAYKTVAMQTAEIRIDLRLEKLPPHLHPSAISSRPVSVASTDESVDARLPGIVPPRNPRRLTSRKTWKEPLPSPAMSAVADDDYTNKDAGNDENGPLSGQTAPMRRPPRINAVFMGLEDHSSDEEDDLMDSDGCDSEYWTALSAPQSKWPNPQTPLPLARAVHRRSSARQVGTTEVDSPSRAGASTRSAAMGSSSKMGAMRKAAIKSNGVATHQRTRSPSLPEVAKPPFPIPTRASSRKPGVYASAPSDGDQSPKGSAGFRRCGSIRKVRSVAVLPRNQQSRRPGSQSPPYGLPEVPGNPSVIPLPCNMTTRRERWDSWYWYQPSNKTHDSETSQRSNEVVDAIAQTMVGEWMYKYVRRRMSFGVGDTKADDKSNDRHKRWVWLAPYERCILWSSKQPSTGSALMGRLGRKFSIQSVLDVKDDKPQAKCATGPIFNRSILILTPQRALKFTAENAERHYIWLSSLSFLAHSQQAVPEMPAMLQPPKNALADDIELSGPKPRKAGIRDSIRLAKAKVVSPASIRSRPRAVGAASSHDDNLISRVPLSMQSQNTNSNATYQPVAFRTEPCQLPNHARDMSRDVAESPFVPRFRGDLQHHVLYQGGGGLPLRGACWEGVHERANNVVLHGRKRSNTGGHVPPPLSFRGFSRPSGPLTSKSGTSLSTSYRPTNSTAESSVASDSVDVYCPAGAFAGPAPISRAMRSVASNGRTSEASSRLVHNFMDAMGTLRMEAFIGPLAQQFDQGGHDKPFFAAGGPCSYGGATGHHGPKGRQSQQQQSSAGSPETHVKRRTEELKSAIWDRHRNGDLDANGGGNHQIQNRVGMMDDLDDWALRDDTFTGF